VQFQVSIEKVKQGMSSLNPNAELYIPLNKQEAKDENEVSGLTTEDSLKDGYKTTWYSCPPKGNSGIDESYLQADADCEVHGFKGLLIDNDSTEKGVHSSSELTKKHCIEEDPEMDLIYLAVMFPNLSEQSLADVYSVNGGDLEASIDMLNELEEQVLCPVDFPEHDVSECRVTEGSSTNLKSVFSGEASGSAAGPSDSGSKLP